MGRPVPEKVRDGLITFGENYRIELGPPLVHIVFENENYAPILRKYGVPQKYLDSPRKDAVGREIYPGVDHRFLAWEDRTKWIWYLFVWRGDRWAPDGTFDGTEVEAVKVAQKRMRSNHGIYS